MNGKFVSISRDEFLSSWGQTYSSLFQIDPVGLCQSTVPPGYREMRLPVSLGGVLLDDDSFHVAAQFLMGMDLDHMVLTEVESTALFTETTQGPFDRDAMTAALSDSLLLHLRAVALGRGGEWCALFDSPADTTTIWRREHPLDARLPALQP